MNTVRLNSIPNCSLRASARSTTIRLPSRYARSIAQDASLPPRTESAGCKIEQEIIHHADKDAASSVRKEDMGRLTERLSQMTDEAIAQGGKATQKAMKEGGFSDELMRRLEARIADSTFKNENVAAFAEISLPTGTTKAARDIATAQPWTGTESLPDATLRMLEDAHKPIRMPGRKKTPIPKGMLDSVDMRMKKALQQSSGERLANARDRTSVYALSQDPTLTEKERESMRKILKERFTSGARPMPSSIQGLAALANERIEDAIGRGQFKNIARGKGVNIEKDHNANSPFLDTTEYFMNKMIQRQDIVPPWIEKQQELVKAANVFRSRMRSDWRRHAARVIASTGGTVEHQIARARGYAAAELLSNPKKQKMEALSEIDAEGKLSQLTVTEVPASSTEDKMVSTILVEEDLVGNAPSTSSPASDDQDVVSDKEPFTSPSTPNSAVSAYPFRDPAWESIEHAYHQLSITTLNNLTRSYNLQAPDLAKKPYFSLTRELRSCFADVAPQLENEIRERARRPERTRVEIIGHRPGGVLEKFSRERVAVYDEQKPQYGFKQFWSDLWGSSR